VGTWAGLTTAALATTPKQPGPKIDYSDSTEWLNVSPEDLAEIAHFRQENCGKCHYSGSKLGPDLAAVQVRADVARLGEHFKTFGRIPLGTAQTNSLAAFVQRLDPQRASALQNAPDFATSGALVYQSHYCFSCHIINGVGAAVGPPLNGLARRRSRSWVEQHFTNPRELTPDTPMPAFRLTAKDLANLTDYLFSLDEGRGSGSF
jgi:mono/diheme cytochrome c family protein